MGLVWRKDDLLTLSEKQLSMANETCQQKIYAGIDVELSGGTEHFSLETHDQANIESMFTAVTLGAKEQQYHCDGGEVKTYSAADVVVLYAAYKNYVTKHTTYCNLLKKWIKRETDNAVIGAIQYGDNLPEDLTAQTIPDGIVRRHLRQLFEFVHDGIHHILEWLFEISILLFTVDRVQLQRKLHELLPNRFRRIFNCF